MATLTKKAHLAQRNKFVSICPTTVYCTYATTGNTGLSLASTIGAAYSEAAPYGSILPGFVKSTLAMTGSLAAGDIFRVPIRSEDSKLVLYVAYDSAFAASTASYPMLAMRIPNPGYSTIQEMTPAWGAGSKTVGSSTGESDWKLIRSTTRLLATTTGEQEAFIAGPFESARYAMNFGPTSSNSIDKNQNYFEFAIMKSSVDTTGTWLSATTNALSTDGCILVLPIEVP